eukprot:Hpha_TRINITY_DN16047_c1_g6::TRINITY_DN16047_c1_g6_i1::g.121181::m.121181
MKTEYEAQPEADTAARVLTKSGRPLVVLPEEEESVEGKEEARHVPTDVNVEDLEALFDEIERSKVQTSEADARKVTDQAKVRIRGRVERLARDMRQSLLTVTRVQELLEHALHEVHEAAKLDPPSGAADLIRPLAAAEATAAALPAALHTSQQLLAGLSDRLAAPGNASEQPLLTGLQKTAPAGPTLKRLKDAQRGGFRVEPPSLDSEARAYTSLVPQFSVLGEDRLRHLLDWELIGGLTDIGQVRVVDTSHLLDFKVSRVVGSRVLVPFTTVQELQGLASRKEGLCRDDAEAALRQLLEVAGTWPWGLVFLVGPFTEVMLSQRASDKLNR